MALTLFEHQWCKLRALAAEVKDLGGTAGYLMVPR